MNDIHDPIRALREEHNLILARLNLFEEALSWLLASPTSLGQLDALVRFLADGVPRHSAKEEACLFPELMAMEDFRPGWSALVAQEREIRTAAAGLRVEWEHLKQAPADHFDALRAEVKHRGERLIHDLREHIREEEVALFPFADRRLSAAQKEAIAAHMTHMDQLGTAAAS